MMEPISEDDELTECQDLNIMFNKVTLSDTMSDNPRDKHQDTHLDLQDLETTDVEDDYQEPIINRRPVTSSLQTISVQPELKLLMLEKQREKEKVSEPVHPHGKSYTEDQQSLLRRFPWLADRMKTAWEDLNTQEHKGSGQLRTAVKQSTRFSSQSILKSRTNKPMSILKTRQSKPEEKDESKVVFSRNIPILMYNKDNKKCIKLGGDAPNEKIGFEEIYRAVHFNPELKKVTLDLEDLRHPEKERTLRLAMSYISANTLHNPYVLTDDMCKFSYKKEVLIKLLVEEIERRLLRQRDKRDERQERQRVQDEEIRQQKQEEEVRGRDFITANRLLEKSKAVDPNILTEYEKKQERKRRIRLRTKSMQTSQRADVRVKQRRFGVPHISLQPHPGADV